MDHADIDIPATIRALRRIRDLLAAPQDRAELDDALAALHQAERDKDLGLRMALLLDGALPLFDAAAERERRREAGKSLRQITLHERAKAARRVLGAAIDAFGYQP